MAELIPVTFLGGVAGNQSIATTSSTANVFGGWTEFGVAPQHANEICLWFEGNDNTLFNIGIGPSGSQNIIIPQLAQQTSTSTYGYSPGFFKIPWNIPAGSTLWAQQSCSASGVSSRVSLGLGNSNRQPCSLLTPLGIDLTTSFCVSETSGSATGTYGAWVSLGTLSIPGKRLWYVSTRASSYLQTLNIGVGPSTAVQPILQNAPVLYTNFPFELEMDCPPGEYWMQVASGPSITTQGGIYIGS